ncbi:hypothetical protein ACXX9E_29805 [Pseudomonas sp. GNP014]
MKKVMGKAGAGIAEPNQRVTLLRNADHDGVAETRTVFQKNLIRRSAHDTDGR